MQSTVSTPTRKTRFSSSEDASPKLITVRHVINSLRKWWLVALPAGVLAAVAVAGYFAMTFEPSYRATMMFKMESNRPYVAYPDRMGNRSFVQNQIELIKSPIVLEPVLDRPDIAEIEVIREQSDPLRWLTSQIAVKAYGASDYFQVSFTGPDKNDAERIVAAVWESYSDEKKLEEDRQTAILLQGLLEEQTRRDGELRDLQEEVRQLATDAVIADPTGRRVAVVDLADTPLAALRTQQAEYQVEEAVLEAKIKSLTDADDDARAADNGVSALMIERAIDQDPQVVAIQADLDAASARLRDYATKLNNHEDDANYRQLSSEISMKELRLKQYRDELRPTIEAALKNQASAQRQQELADLQSELDSLQLTMQQTDKRYKEEEDALRESTGQSLDLEFKRDDLARAETVYGLITARIVQIQTEQGAPERISRVWPAKASPLPIETLPYKQMLLGSLAVFCVPFCLAVVWERLVERVSHVEQFDEENTQLPVIGEIAELPRRVRRPGASGALEIPEGVAVYRESFDNLRTLLLLSKGFKEGHTLAVTSAANNEGKTSVSVQLAASLARSSDGRVLVIDGDMRSPDVHRVLGISRDVGLAEVLAGECSLDEAVHCEAYENVDVLPAGRLRGVPHRLVCGDALPELLDVCRGRYSSIIIDTPPILAASEALVFAKAADACLMVAMRDVSRVSQVQQAYDRLIASGAPAVGAVLNGVPTRRYTRHYGHYAYQTSSRDKRTDAPHSQMTRH